MKPAPLDVFFHPRSVAVLGATEKPASVGRAIVANLQATSFGGPLYVINPKHTTVLGLPCFASLAAIPGKVDLAVIVIPAMCVPDAVRQCAAAGVQAVVIISAGFREIGPAGVALEHEVLEIARAAGMRIVGPNCIGVMSPLQGLNATFAASMARPGNLGLISQSGAICTAILDWSQQENVGFSAFVSTGTMLDVEWGDLIEYLGDDPHTRSIIVYMESVPNAPRFLAAAQKVAPTKPIIVLKPGRTEAAAKAAASHTGALTGRDDVFDAAFRRCGILRVDTIAELFNLAEALDKQPRPKGPRLMMVTNAGGMGVLAADALLGEGGQLAELALETTRQLDAILPPSWSHHNPVDILGDATAERYEQAVKIAAADPNTDGVLIALAPQAMTDPSAVAQHIIQFAQLPGKPVLAAWMGGPAVAEGQAILNAARMPSYHYADSAARVFQSMWRYTANLELLQQRAEIPAAVPTNAILEKVRAAGRTLLTEVESKQLLAAYSIPTVPTEIAITPDDAVRAAVKLGYPVVVKVHSETVTHKTDVGGVRLNVKDEAGVRESYKVIEESVAAKAGAGNFLGVTIQPMVNTSGYELILGASADPQFGPVLLFGGGGQLVEVYKDRAIALPPLNATLARHLMRETKIYRALEGVRGRKPVDLAALDHLLVRFSQLVVEQTWIQEIDINPLLASPEQLIALDARVILYPADAPAPPRAALLPALV
ncbi:MAG: acetate--CoA ligase family protein [Acidobacteriota bacterium]